MRIFSLGDSALTIEFGNELSSELNARSLNLAASLQQDPFPGFVEAVPAYSSVTVFYYPAAVRKSFDNFPSAFAAVSERAEIAVKNISSGVQIDSRLVEIPVICDESSGLDLTQVSKIGGLTESEVLDIFFSSTYRVYMLGFFPGFAYMGEVDERIAAPRLGTPRTKVPKGSVGIAGKQTGIYPLESPGGWNIIGRTELEMFDPSSDEPCLLRPGDEVRFVRF